MHSIIIEEEKHNRREHTLIRKHTKEDEKHAIQTIPEKAYNMNAYLKYTVEFCNKILSSNTRYLLSIKCKRMDAT